MYVGPLDPVTNRQDWQFIREIIDEDTGEAVDISGATITFEVREKGDDQQYGGPTGSAILSATTGNGKITITGTGTFQVWFPLSDMQTLVPGYYDVGCTILINDVTTQLLAATLPVMDGVVGT